MAGLYCYREPGHNVVDMKLIKNEKGMALMMTMMVSAIALSVMATLMYMLTLGAQVSGGGKRFASALEAGKGCMQVVSEYIGSRGELDAALETAIEFQLSSSFTNTCMLSKLNKGTYYEDLGDRNDEAHWDETCDSELDIDAEDSATYDFTVTLGDYTCYAKIVDSTMGNTGGSSNQKEWITTSVVTVGGGGGGGTTPAMRVPYYYTIELESRWTYDEELAAKFAAINKKYTAPEERTRLPILYQY